MSLTQSLLRSPVVGALTSPHGVDRYLELVNPMWVVHEVRARIVDITRETRAGEPVATVTLEPSRGLARPRGRPVRPGRRRGRRRPAYPLLLGLLPGVRARATSSRSRCAPTPTGRCRKHLVHDAQVGDVIHLSQAEGDVHAAQPAAAARCC